MSMAATGAEPRIEDLMDGLVTTVRVQGPDPKDTKSATRPFASSQNGVCVYTASTTAFATNDTHSLWITPATVLAPFLSAPIQTTPQLVAGASVALFVRSEWLPATPVLMVTVDCPLPPLAQRLPSSAVRGVHFQHVIVLAIATPWKLALPAATACPALGSPVTIVGSPFAIGVLDVLGNSMTKGVCTYVVNSTTGKHPLLLTDARSLHGSEGGCAFTTHGRLLGMVTHPVAGHDAFGSIIPWTALQAAIQPRLDPVWRLPAQATTSISELPLQQASDALVLIQTPSTRASGFIVHQKGLVLTCGHAIPVAAVGSHVTCVLPGSQQVRAKVLYKSSNLALDIAMLALAQPSHACAAGVDSISWAACTLQDEPLALGCAVYNVSYRCMDTWVPVISGGHIAKCVRKSGITVGLQTSSHVVEGNSGGMLVNAAGRVVGMITSHAVIGGCRHCTVAFAMPTHWLRPFVALGDKLVLLPDGSCENPHVISTALTPVEAQADSLLPQLLRDPSAVTQSKL